MEDRFLKTLYFQLLGVLTIGNIDVILLGDGVKCGVDLAAIPEERVLLLLVDRRLDPKDAEAIARESARKNSTPETYVAIVKPIGIKDTPQIFGNGSDIARSLFSRYYPFSVYFLSK